MSKEKYFTCSDCEERKPLQQLEYANTVINEKNELIYLQLCDGCYTDDNTLLVTVKIVDDELPF